MQSHVDLRRHTDKYETSTLFRDASLRFGVTVAVGVACDVVAGDALLGAAVGVRLQGAVGAAVLDIRARVASWRMTELWYQGPNASESSVTRGRPSPGYGCTSRRPGSTRRRSRGSPGEG